MLIDGFRVTLRASTGEAYPEIQHQGRTYVVGVTSAAYSIELAPPADNHARLQAKISVDGRSINHRPKLKRPFRLIGGFLVSTDGQLREQAFRFARPSTDGAALAAALQCSGDSPAGCISVTFFESGTEKESKRQRSTQGPHLCVAGTPAVKKAEGVKWHQRASLATAAADPVPSSITLSRYRRKKGRNLCTAKLYVETATVLRLRKILDVSKPEHQVILRDFMEEISDEAPVQQPAAVAPQADEDIKPQTSKWSKLSKTILQPVIDLTVPPAPTVIDVELT